MIHALTTLILLALPAQTEKKETLWQTKYADALAQALKEGKPLILDAGREA